MSAPLHFDVAGAEGPRQYFGALDKLTMAHAYLFSGPPGVGKKTFARKLAQSLLCQRTAGGLLGYDGSCASCALFAAPDARHPDFVECEGSIAVGDHDAPRGFYDGEDLSAREIVRMFSMQSYAGGMRVLLLGDVAFASPNAANALLKFLEESPAGVVTILTTAAPSSLLDTIASRLVDVRFPALSGAQTASVLRTLGYAEADAARAAAASGGSVTRAIAALDRDDDSLRATVARWFFECAGGGTPERTWATRETLADGLETVKTLARDWVAGTIAGAAPSAPDYAGELRALPPLAAGGAVELLTKLDEAQRLAATNVSPNLVGEFVRMSLSAVATKSG